MLNFEFRGRMWDLHLQVFGDVHDEGEVKTFQGWSMLLGPETSSKRDFHTRYGPIVDEHLYFLCLNNLFGLYFVMYIDYTYDYILRI